MDNLCRAPTTPAMQTKSAGYCKNWHSYPVMAVAAVSLGGSMLLNYLAAEGRQAIPCGSSHICPLDLVAASTRLDRGLGRCCIPACS
jgi:predicted alpha/beta-fold hydrolase